MRSNAPSNAIARCASPANASSTPIAASASTPSRRPFMGSFRYRDDQPHEEPAVTLDAFLEQPDATAVRLEAGEDARRLIPYLDRLQLRSEEHTSELQSLMRRSHAVFCLTQKT